MKLQNLDMWGESRPGNKKVKRKKKDKTSEIRVEPRESKEVS